MNPDLGDEFWGGEREKLIRILLPIVTNAALSAAEQALLGLQDEYGIGVDWRLVNEQVQQWAQRYTYDLVGGITQTSRDFLQGTVSEWIANGQPLDELIATLEPMFGTTRAALIAATEVTRAFAEGNQETWRQSGVVDGVRWMTAQDELVCTICAPLDGETSDLSKGFDGPPAHPNCRCYLQPVVNVGKATQPPQRASMSEINEAIIHAGRVRPA